MNDNAKAWVAALRSGEYKQTTGILCDLDGYCCLGVACEVAVKAGLPVERIETSTSVYFDGCGGRLPDSVRDWLGLASDVGRMGSKYSLVHRNDKGTPFDEIADLIESEPEGLFAK